MGMTGMQHGGVRRSRWRRWVFRGAVGLVVTLAGWLGVRDAIRTTEWMQGSGGGLLELTRAELEELAPGAGAKFPTADRFVVPYGYRREGWPEVSWHGVRIVLAEVEAEEYEGPEWKYAALSSEDQAWVQRAAAAGGRYEETYPEVHGSNLRRNLLAELPARAVQAGVLVMIGFGVRWAWRRLERWSARPEPWACRSCGYPCRGIRSKRCPECGEWLGW